MRFCFGALMLVVGSGGGFWAAAGLALAEVAPWWLPLCTAPPGFVLAYFGCQIMEADIDRHGGPTVKRKDGTYVIRPFDPWY